ncbi:hypothetical protein HOD61_02945 [archaeon]|jgi:hypothetical protein|nr:hypothetical protein [archaeon]
MKKGQIEMIGLVVIVFLVILIGMFALRLSSFDSDNDVDIYYSVKVDNLVNAIYQSDIGSESFQSLAIGCCDGNSGSCNKVELFVRGVLDSVIEEKVNFMLKDSTGINCAFVDGECSEGIGSSSIFLPGGHEIRAILCRK